MRHQKDHRKLGRTSPHRMALLRNMVVALIQHDRIETTLPKAKELRRIADRVVTLGKRGTLASRRRARRWVPDKDALNKVFSDLAVRFKDRMGGYTRIFQLNPRFGDDAKMALIEYLPGIPDKAPSLDGEEKGKKEKKKVTKAKGEPKAKKAAEKSSTTHGRKKSA